MDSAADNMNFIYRQIRRSLAFFSHRFKSHDEMAELAQDAYLRVMRQQQQKPIENIEGYIYQTTRNLTMNLGRRRASEQRHVTTDDPELNLSTNELSPLDSILLEERITRLKQAIYSLPPRCRQVFILHKVNGMSYAEIAKAMKITESGVGKHLNRAMHHCENALRDLYP